MAERALGAKPQWAVSQRQPGGGGGEEDTIVLRARVASMTTRRRVEVGIVGILS